MTKKIYIICVLAFLTFSNSFGQKVDETILFSNFLKVMHFNPGTISSYVVINVKYTKTGQEREICTNPNFLLGAIHKEHDIAYDEAGIKRVDEIIRAKKNRTFNFYKEESIKNLGIELYSEKDLAKVEKKNDFDSIVDSIRLNRQWKYESFDDRMCCMFAHILFNRGIITKSNSCFFNGIWAVVE